MNSKPGDKKNRVLLLRGLPFAVTEHELMTFLEENCVMEYLASRPVVLLTNANGRPSGFAEVKMNTTADFWEVREMLHMQRLGGRYIEVLSPTGNKSYGREFQQSGSFPQSASTPTRSSKNTSWRRDR